MEYKHFSHIHGLVIHQVPQESEITCSGCNFPGTGSVYMCWPCRFFLHDYCFNASRSMNHPSHPSHLLSLFPYPTYPSNSFYCNHCSLVGTGFSYGCSHCEFDLHVHCTHLPPNTMFGNSTLSVPNETPVFYPQQAAVYHNPIPTTNTSDPPPYNYPNPSYAVPNQVPESDPQHVHRPQNNPNPNEQMQIQGTKHFSHSHPLHLSKVTEKDHITCSACERNISGSSYSCKSPEKCNFNLHETCFELRQQIHHPSHPDHPLTLLSSPPYKDNNAFVCNACLENGTGFAYHCSICNYDLHITCASLPEAVERDGHEHTLRLTYISPVTEQMRKDHPDIKLSCDVCQREIDERGWLYICGQCNYGTHWNCVNDKEIVVEQVPVSATNSSTKYTDTLKFQVEMQRMQLQMQMAQQHAQMMVGFGQSISNSGLNMSSIGFQFVKDSI